MFEEELELEKKASSVIPLLLIIALAALIIGTAGYWYIQAKQVLTPAEAATMVGDILKAQGPATLEFRTGLLNPSVSEKLHDPHYKLLAKGGYVKLANAKNDTVNVSLTDKGAQELTAIPGFKKKAQNDGTELLTVPLAQRKLVEISKVTMVNPSIAKVEYTWNWQPTALGELFDASGPALKSFNMWETQTLIQKYGAAFYHGAPTRAQVSLVKTDKNTWKIMTD